VSLLALSLKFHLTLVVVLYFLSRKQIFTNPIVSIKYQYIMEELE